MIEIASLIELLNEPKNASMALRAGVHSAAPEDNSNGGDR
jgi:hypothetical protein